MRPNRPRLSEKQYFRRRRYSLTFCTAERRQIFTQQTVVDLALSQISRAGREREFSVIAYCFMPDHVHLLVQSMSPSCSLEKFVHAAKQYSGFAYAKHTGQQLWQHSYFDHALRDDESIGRAVRYILGNPIRAGLVQRVDEYPFSGSEIYTMSDLLQFVNSHPVRRP